MKSIKAICFLLFITQLKAQVGIGTTSVEPNAQLELTGNTQGLLIPRLVLTDTSNPSPLTNHVKGMIIYNTSNNGVSTNRVVEGLYYNDGSRWVLFVPNFIKIGDLKHSFATADHNGWYLLDGRPISTLSETAQANAMTFGLTLNLINASNRFLKVKNGSETLGSLAGNNTFTLDQSNLPNVNFLGTTSSNGSHAHNVDSYMGFQSIGLLSTGILTLFSIEQVAKDQTNTTSSTTQSSGSHAHDITVNSGGLGVPVPRVPSFMSTNIFIYLGK